MNNNNHYPKLETKRGVLLPVAQGSGSLQKKVGTRMGLSGWNWTEGGGEIPWLLSSSFSHHPIFSQCLSIARPSFPLTIHMLYRVNRKDWKQI